jgi:nitrite reductase (NADH) small subunit
MSNWVRVGHSSDVPPGSSREVLAGDRVVAVFNCPLGEGELCGTTVTCPWHGWQFDVRTGEHRTSASVRQPTLAVKIEGAEIWVDVGQ